MPVSANAQIENDVMIGQIIEHLAENNSDDQDYTELTEQLNFYIENPLDINIVEGEQLKELVFISPVQIDQLLLHRKVNGLFQDLLEIQSIEGFDNETARWLMNFLTIKSPALLSNVSLPALLSKSTHDLIIRFGKLLQEQKGFTSSDSTVGAYAGSADRLFTRYRFNYSNRILFALNVEKDAGEPFLKNGGGGFDFYSGSVSLKGQRLIKKLVIGDYGLQFGQGLSMWSGLGFGKGACLTTVTKQATGLRPYSSVNESSFLRGASATFGHNGILFTPFFSYRKLDGVVSEHSGEISSLPQSGLHRTSAERANKNAVTQLIYGLNTSYVNDRLNFGFTTYKTLLDKPVAAGNSLYELYNFRSASLTNLGLHYTYTFRNTYFFGEAAHSLSSGSAFVNGLLSSLSSQLSAVLFYRNYARNYHSFFNQGISESTDAANERGLYTGILVKFNSAFDLTGYIDFFRFPWLKFRVDAPSQGHELFSQVTYSFNKSFKITGRFKHQQKEENISGNSMDNGLETIRKQNFRIEINYKANSSFTFRNRAEMSTYKRDLTDHEYGFLSFHDIIYNPLSSKFSGNVRFALFDTQGFNSRIYTYENDVLYAYSVPAYQGKGLRCYLNGRFTPQRGVDIWLRYALASYFNQETIGSGNDLISGSRRSELKLQVRFQL